MSENKERQGVRAWKCMFFETQKGCKNGEKCLFQHDAAAVVRKIPKRCWFFGSKTGCRNGKHCFYLHDDDTKSVCPYLSQCRFKDTCTRAHEFKWQPKKLKAQDIKAKLLQLDELRELYPDQKEGLQIAGKDVRDLIAEGIEEYPQYEIQRWMEHSFELLKGAVALKLQVDHGMKEAEAFANRF